MVIKKHSKRIYYSSGIISLLLLPLLCFWFLEKRKVFQKETAIEINAYKSRLPKNSIGRSDFVDEYFRNPISKININGNPASFKVKLDSIKKLVAVINSIEFATNCVLITFEDDAKYETFIKVLDYIDSAKCKLYGSHLNKILIFNKPLKIEEEEIKRQEKLNRTIRNIEVNPIINLDCCLPLLSVNENELKQEKENEKEMKKLIYSFYPAWLFLIIMLILTFIKAKKLNQIRQ